SGGWRRDRGLRGHSIEVRARSTWILTLAVGLASCAIAAACTSRSGTTFAPPDAGYEISEGGSFGSADTGPPQRAQCGCDGGALEIRVSGDGADQILTHSNPATGCTSDVPTGYFFTCGGADWYTEQIAACGASAADAPCILFDRQPTPAGYVDREGGVWTSAGQRSISMTAARSQAS
ncbi:MAG: hypothetical protein ACREJX_05635, partial [Polyangiaceae bacterium]